jgi:sulfide:quinone oxidoreductase
MARLPHAARLMTMAGHDKFRVVIAGGGVAALEAMVALRALAAERLDVMLVAPDDVFSYRPLAVAEPFGLGTVARFSLPVLAAGCGARYERGAIMLVSPEAHQVYTSRSRTLDYDALVIAPGTRTDVGVRGATTFRGPADARAIELLLEDLRSGLVRRVVFAIPTAASWALPIYELALLTAERCAAEGSSPELTVVTSEDIPLGVFDGEASSAVRTLLDERGIALRTGAHAISFVDSRLEIVGSDPIEADRVVALPKLTGRIIEGIPHDGDGFIATDTLGSVAGLDDVYAAGDVTSFPLKQGGIAAQQADSVASAIAARAGAEVTPKPFQPVLRGLLLTGGRPTFMRAEVRGGQGKPGVLDEEPLWWPAGKIAARHLSPYLAQHSRPATGSRDEPAGSLV